MFVEIHVIQNFAPSNLNRSDTGTPKDCDFGGYRRARVSSQCFKRAMRSSFTLQSEGLIKNLALRSKRLHKELSDLIKDKKVNIADEEFVIESVLATCGIYLTEEKIQLDSDGQEKSAWVKESETLAFLGKDTLEKVTQIIIDHQEEVAKAADVFKKYREDKRKGEKYKGNLAKEDKKDLRGKAKKALGKEVTEKIEKALDGSRAADLALFGRMLADLPEKNIDAACQVAHAISTHKAGVEFDFYTAVDDLLPQGETGAGMMGTLEFNSACFYRYANIDLNQLKTNLKDQELEEATIEAFVRAFVDAVPTGKQNSHAAQQKPSFVMVVARDAGLLSLANAFAKPVQTNKGDLVQESIKALDQHWGEMSEMYGSKGIKGKWFASSKMKKLDALGESVKAENGNSMIDVLIAEIKTSIKPNQA